LFDPRFNRIYVNVIHSIIFQRVKQSQGRIEARRRKGVVKDSRRFWRSFRKGDGGWGRRFPQLG
jgi:hypothetical protein